MLVDFLLRDHAELLPSRSVKKILKLELLIWQLLQMA